MHPAPQSEPSTAAGSRAGADVALIGRAGGGKGRELLLDALPSALGTLRWLLLACQDEFLEDVSAVRTGVLKDRHGKPNSLLWYDVAAFLLGIPRLGAQAARSRDA